VERSITLTLMVAAVLALGRPVSAGLGKECKARCTQQILACSESVCGTDYGVTPKSCARAVLKKCKQFGPDAACPTTSTFDASGTWWFGGSLVLNDCPLPDPSDGFFVALTVQQDGEALAGDFAGLGAVSGIVDPEAQTWGVKTPVQCEPDAEFGECCIETGLVVSRFGDIAEAVGGTVTDCTGGTLGACQLGFSGYAVRTD